MININLLPWRDYERAYQYKKQQRLLLLGMMLVGLIGFFMHIYYYLNCHRLEKQLAQLQTEIQQHSQAIKALTFATNKQQRLIAEFYKLVNVYKAHATNK